MVKRELDQEEKKIYEKKIADFKDGIALLEGEKKRLDFSKDFLLEHNYNKSNMEVKQGLGNVNQQIKELEGKVKIMGDHLKNGVEVKEKKEEKKNDA